MILLAGGGLAINKASFDISNTICTHQEIKWSLVCKNFAKLTHRPIQSTDVAMSLKQRCHPNLCIFVLILISPIVKGLK